MNFPCAAVVSGSTGVVIVLALCAVAIGAYLAAVIPLAMWIRRQLYERGRRRIEAKTAELRKRTNRAGN